MLKTQTVMGKRVVYSLLGTIKEVEDEIDNIFKNHAEQHPQIERREALRDNQIFVILWRDV